MPIEFYGAIALQTYLEEGAKLPEKAHEWDAGFDLFAPEKVVVPAHGSATVDTKVHMMIPHGWVGFLKSKSGLNVKHGITCEGVIDSEYTGSIVAKLRNDSDEDHVFNEGDKLTQIVVLRTPYVVISQVKSIEELGDTDRGANGFGSSGK